MKKSIRKIYCDTSIFGGVFDEEFKVTSDKFFALVKIGLFDLVVSPLVDEEIHDKNTPQQVIDFYDKILPITEAIKITKEAITLQEAYIKEKILTPKWEDDALHVALATVYECDMIVSWNFTHIVNFQKIPLYNAVNILHGYKTIEIYSPSEVVEIDER